MDCERLLNCCFSICSSYQNFHEEIVKLIEIFQRNSYPEKIKDRCIKNFLNKLHVRKVVELTTARKVPVLVSPYLELQTVKIRNKIQWCLKKKAPIFHLKVVFQSKKRLSTLFTFKDKINKLLHSNLVYKTHTDQSASFDDFETLVKESDEFRLFVREWLLILRDDPPLNRYVKLIPLEPFS